MTDEHDSPEARHWAYYVPPVSALAAFEAIVRLGSFAAAAEELNRTPSAISHSIREIEKRMGVVLFQRQGRKVGLTPIGRTYLYDVQHAIDALKRATRTLQLHTNEPAIRISAPPLFVATVLIPHMAAFEQECTPYKLKIETTNQLANFDAEDLDIAIRFARREDQHLHTRDLPSVWGIPVCSPAYLQQHNITQTADLRSVDLIQVAQSPDSWAAFFRHAGIRTRKNQKKVVFDSTISALEAARQGLGVALGMFPMTAAYPGYGNELVKASQTALPYTDGYRIVCRKVAADLPKIQLFSNWLQTTMQNLQT